MRTVTISALNIVMPPPHDAERYVQLLKDSYLSRRIIKIRGDIGAILGTFGEDVGDGFYYGEIFKFYNLKIKGKWLNMIQQAPAEEKDLRELNVPDYLKPGLEAFPFFFHAHSHKLFFVSKELDENLGPQDAGRYFKELLNQPNLVESYGEIKVTVIPDEDSLDKILNLPDLRRLHIVITPPNPDNLEMIEQKIKQKLEGQHAATMVTVLVAQKGESLEPDEQTRQLSAVAKENGYVEARGATETGKVENFSTKKHPMLIPEPYDPNVETVRTALGKGARNYFVRRGQRVS